MNEQLNLYELVDNASITTQLLDSNTKTKNRIENAKNEVLKIESLSKDNYILQVVKEELLKLPRIKTKNTGNIFSKNQSSLDFLREIQKEIDKKEEQLVSNVEKELHGAKILDTELYKTARNKAGIPLTLSSVILDKYDERGSLRRNMPNKEPKEVAKILASTHSQKILITSSQNPVRRSVHNYEKKVEHSLNPQVSSLNKPEYSTDFQNIESEFKSFEKNKSKNLDFKINNLKAYHPLADTPTLKNLKNEIETLTKELDELKKAEIMLNRLSNFISIEMDNGQKIQLETKLQKEKIEFTKRIKELQSRLSEVEQKFEIEYQNQEQKAIELENTKTKSQEKEIKLVQPTAHFTPKIKKTPTQKEEKETKLVQPTAIFTPNIKKSNIKEQKEKLEEAKEKLLANKDLLEENKSVNKEQDYEKYKEIRDKFDSMLENKSQYKNNEIFEQHVVNELRQYGSTYEEIVNNIRDMRNNLPATKQIEQIVNNLKTEYNSIEEMNKEDENGLTNIENRIIGRLITTQANGNISEQLNSEITYYVKKHGNLESDIKYVSQNKQYFDSDIYQAMLNELKTKYYINTELIDEVDIQNKIGRSK